MIARVNDDLSREYQAIIAYVVYSQTLKGAAATIALLAGAAFIAAALPARRVARVDPVTTLRAE